jgi:6-pyruvoyl-tetrahydropterin synthase
MISTLTLPYLTCIDHAYVDDIGRIRGRSYHASFTVSGKVDEEGEKVVVDFSKVKKLIKSIVDDHEYGFDHKLWVDSNCKEDANPRIATPFALLNIPENAIRSFPKATHVHASSACFIIAQHVQDVLLNVHGIEVDIKCALNTSPLFIQAGGVYGMFSYVHGLRDSSAYGCQNLAHGHLSYLQLIPKVDIIRMVVDPVHCADEDNALTALDKVCNEICKDLDDTIFIYGANVWTASTDEVSIAYTSKSRGSMGGKFKNNERQKTVVLETETTVEYLAEYINAKYGELLREAGVDKFIVSEGLSKGVLFEVTS